MRGLPQWFCLRHKAKISYCFGRLPLPCPMFRQRLQSDNIAFPPSFSLRQHPLRIALLQQRSPVQRDCPFERERLLSRNQPVEGDHVAEGVREVKGQRGACRREKAMTFGTERIPQFGQGATQVEGGAFLSGFRPEG